MRWIGGAIFGTAQHGEDDRFEEEQSKTRRDSGNNQATFAHLGEDDEIQRNQECGEGDGGTSRPVVDVRSLSWSGGEKIDCSMREPKNQQGKQDAAGIETPGQKQSGGEHAHIVEGQRGRNRGEQRAIDERRCQRQ